MRSEGKQDQVKMSSLVVGRNSFGVDAKKRIG